MVKYYMAAETQYDRLRLISLVRLSGSPGRPTNAYPSQLYAT